MAHQLPPLPYDYQALEPAISRQIMELHHTKHHQTYVNNLNVAEQKYAQAKSPKERIGLQSALNFNGGGHINHSLFWKNLSPNPESYDASQATKQVKPVGGQFEVVASTPFGQAVIAEFGSREALEELFNAKTAAIQGSGWGWLGVDPRTKKLVIETTANQDPLSKAFPLIGIDIWEHAFYLQYKNDKGTYLKNIWKVINWEEAAARYSEAVNGVDAASKL